MKTSRVLRNFGLTLVAGLLLLAASTAYGVTQQNAYAPYEQYATGRIMNRQETFSKHNADLMFGKDPPNDKWQGFFKFDLSGIPENAYITDVSIVYKVVSVSNPGPSTYITILSSNPVSADASTLWSEITGGTYATGSIVEQQGWVERPLNSDGKAAVQSGLAQDWVAFGLYKYDETDTKGHAKGYEAPPSRPYLKISYAGVDLGVTAILAPLGNVLYNSLLNPSAVVNNHGDLDVPFTVSFEVIDGEQVVYSQTQSIAGLPPGQSLTINFGPWQSVGQGERVDRVRVTAQYDNHDDNQLLDFFFILAQQQSSGPLIWGWQETRSVPGAPSNRPVKKGGWLAVDRNTGMIYAAKGNRTGDFFSFDPVQRKWTQLASIPGGPSGRMPGNGTRGVAGEDGYIYLAKGNGTFEFWRYSIAGNTWEQLPNVQAGYSNKPVKAGLDLAWIPQYGTGYVYALKGPRSDFMRYDVQARAWENLAVAPTGSSNNWGKGSWLVWDGGDRLYAHKPKKHEMYAYDVYNDVWLTQPLAGVPFLGAAGRVNKSKDGGAGAFHNGGIWSLKGGKNQEYWFYDPDLNRWQEFEPMPEFGSTGRVVRNNAGSDLIAHPFSRTLYALKGNNTLEFWRYTMAPEGQGQNVAGGDPGAMAGAEPAVPKFALAVSPNPAVGRRARIAWSVPQAGPVRLAVYDLSGRAVIERHLSLSQGSGSLPLDLHALSAGTYVVRLQSGSLSAMQKVVVQQ